MFYKVEAEVLQVIINYLGNRPFVEVEKLITAIQKSEPIVDKPVDEVKESSKGNKD